MARSTNSGVHANIGFEFQKHCALYILIRDYETLKTKKFYLYLEHHDDFLYCFQNKNGEIEFVDSYQVKKSSKPWSINDEMYEILGKIIQSAVDISSELANQNCGIDYSLHFGSNSNIEFKHATHPKTVNEANSLLKYIDLHSDIKAKICGGLNAKGAHKNLHELDKSSFLYFDLSRTSQGQFDQLVGAFGGVFGQKVADHRAAVKTLLSLFREVEVTLNQGNIARFLDHSKRIDSELIRQAINVIEKKAMAFELWRANANLISEKMQIPISSRARFQLNIQSSFDLFKDLSQVSHQKIMSFVKRKKRLLETETNEIECINKLYRTILIEESVILPEDSIKAAILAAYIEVKEEEYAA